MRTGSAECLQNACHAEATEGQELWAEGGNAHATGWSNVSSSPKASMRMNSRWYASNQGVAPGASPAAARRKWLHACSTRGHWLAAWLARLMWGGRSPHMPFRRAARVTAQVAAHLPTRNCIMQAKAREALARNDLVLLEPRPGGTGSAPSMRQKWQGLVTRADQEVPRPRRAGSSTWCRADRCEGPSRAPALSAPSAPFRRQVAMSGTGCASQPRVAASTTPCRYSSAACRTHGAH
jgi:hypothetical protein